MTTPTREQALTPAELRELCAQLSEDGQAMLHRAVYAAHISGLEIGRAQGLREAAAKVRAILADCEQQDIDDPELEVIAAAIEQLRA